MPRVIRLGRLKIGAGEPTFVAAEMSGNHRGSLHEALAIVDAAAAAGARALKIQTYTADTMTLNLRDKSFMVSQAGFPWRGKSLYELYGEAHTPWKWHKAIFERCRKRGILGFSTPFDASAVDFLESLDVPLYKISSYENTDLPLIKRAAKTKKPMIISVGMIQKAQIRETVDAARSAGCKDLVLLKCTTDYPASLDDANLRTIPDLAKEFNCWAGLSDHTRTIGVGIAAAALGAVVIECHLTRRRLKGGVDASFSLEPAELKALVQGCGQAKRALGRVRYGASEREKKSRIFRRSLFVVEDTRKGERFSPANIRNIRPGFGIEPKYYERVLGKRARQNLKKGTAFRWEFVESGGRS